MIKELVLDDIFLSPILWHILLLLASFIRFAVFKLLSRSNESEGWDGAVILLLFCNPFLAYFADSFWNVWLQSFFLGPLLYILAFYFRTRVLGCAEYSDPAAANMLGLFVFVLGHVFSIIPLLILYVWKSL